MIFAGKSYGFTKENDYRGRSLAVIRHDKAGFWHDKAGKLDEKTKPGHGVFFDLSKTPELQKLWVDYLVNDYGWTLENPFFIRKS